MKKHFVSACFLVWVFLFSLATLKAQNPIIQTMYTADPAPLVYKDTVFLYVGRDEAKAPKNHYLMREYRLFTSTDMVNWTDRGAALRTSEVVCR
jgi:arabinoxylan arabinofuranohydrolase